MHQPKQQVEWRYKQTEGMHDRFFARDPKNDA